MPVARTYEKYPIEGEVYKKDGKSYVKVRAKSGLKEVRWYTDAEYRRIYPEAKETKNDIMDFNARHVFGFGDLGFITIYKGNQTSLEECVEMHHDSFRRNLTFGYYTPSRLNLCDLPSDVIPVKLYWSDVMAHDDRMKSHEEVQKIVAAMLNDESASAFQGEVNEWLQKTVTIREKKSKDSHFGTKHTYTLEDSDGNTYIWETGAKDYPIAKTISLKMKVKEHKEINNEKVTVVWYCKEV